LSWQSTVYNRLKIGKNQKRIILDKTGVLLHESFLEYLKAKEIRFEISNSLPEILVEAGSNDFGIVLSLYRELPTSLSNKIDVTVYDYSLFPIDIEYPLAQSLSTDNLIALLCFYSDSGRTNLITESNIKNELVASEKHQKEINCAATCIFSLSSDFNLDFLMFSTRIFSMALFLN